MTAAKKLPEKARIALLHQAVRAQPQSAALLCELSEALAEAGEEREAAKILRQAYVLRPDICGAALTQCRSICADPGKVRNYARSLIDNGVAYAPVIAAL